MPMPVFTFLEEYNFTGKTVIPFTSYGENVFGRSLESIKELAPDATIADGLAVQEHNMQDLPERVTAWLQNLGIGNDTDSEDNPNQGSEANPGDNSNQGSETEPGDNSNQGSETEPGNNTDSKDVMDISDNARITLSKTSYVYDGKAKKPNVTVQADSVELAKNLDYAVSYVDNIKVGTASVVITGIGNYTGVVTGTFAIVPKGTSISGKITAKSKGFTLKWKKTAQSLSGYQIQYSTSKKFTKKTTAAKIVKGSSATKLTVSKLKAGKTYYVRLRNYKTVGGKKYYSNWSGTKSVKTKK